MRKERQIVGILSDVSEHGKRNVFINSGGHIQFNVTPLIANEELPDSFTGYISSFTDDFEDNMYASDDERIDHFYDEVNGKMFVFSYIPNYDNDYPKMRDVSLVPIPDSYTSDTKYIAIPVFASVDDEKIKEWVTNHNWRLYRDFSTVEAFSENVRNRKPVGSIYKMDIEDHPISFVAWKEKEGKIYAFGKIDKLSYDTVGGIILESEGRFKIDITNYLKHIIYNININPTIMFISEDMYKRIADEFIKKQSEINDESSKIKHEEKKEIDKSINNGDNENIAHPKDIIVKDEKKEEIDKKNFEDYLEKSDNEVIEINRPSDRLLEEISNEKVDGTIIKHMEYHSQGSNLFFSQFDFINLHTSIKCSNLTILSGLSGTGKTQIVDIYAKALGIQNSSSDDSRLLYVPVRPSWNDDSDLLGYIDLVHMVYRPSDTGFVDFLVNAQKEVNKNKLFIVCFDEMNLARVEHYFSQFLSILERPDNQRELVLYDKQYRGRLYNASDYPDRIIIRDNIKFIGTVNIDETTYHFSDKVLDRANIINLDILDYSKDWIKKQFATISHLVWTTEDYKALIKKTNETDYIKVREFLWDMHNVLRNASDKFGIGPRIVKAIESYLNNIPEGFELFDKKIGLDYQVLQRILTKVRGPENQLGEILIENSDKNIIKLFDKYSDLSDFQKSRNAIKQKQKELNTYGYCI